MEIRSSDNRLRIGTTEIETPYAIREVLESQKLFLVLFEPRSSVELKRNISAFDRSGEEVWLIEKTAYEGSPRDPFMHMWLEDGKLYADSWEGVTYEVDLDTGAIEPLRWCK